MTTAALSPVFYVTGGTLRQGSASYIARQADTDLYASLMAGEYCYVLNARQMGKSSLMVHTAQRLRAEGHAVAVLDLTAIGQNLTPEQWYDGLLLRLGRQLDLEDEFDDYYQDNPRLSPMQRCFTAIEQIALPAVKQKLILFVDEIDVVRSLPFSADEFFAAIRQCYVERATNADFSRLVFCLLGTATPADLVKDTRVSPFNIGRRIEVCDFTDAEAAPLAEGLRGNSKAVLNRVLYWTGGHPYLTQRLCLAAAETEAKTPTQVDSLCDELFLAHKAKETDDNLTFVRSRLLNSEADVASLLDLYSQVRQGRAVPDDDTSPLPAILKLSGVAGVEKGLLRVRNRIYGHVFDKAWITAHMPDAELRRQREAYRKGLIRALTLSSAVLLIMSLLAGVAFKQKLNAEASDVKASEASLNAASERKAKLRIEISEKAAKQSALEAEKQREIAQQNQRKAQKYALDRTTEAKRANNEAERANHNAATERVAEARATRLAGKLRQALQLETNEQKHVERLSYPFMMTRAQEAISLGNFPKAQTYMARYAQPVSVSDDPRGFEWNYLRHECRNTPHRAFSNQKDGICSLACSPDGILLASGSDNCMVWLTTLKTQRSSDLPVNAKYTKPCVTFSPDGRSLAIAISNRIRLWEVKSEKESSFFPLGEQSDVKALSLAYSPDGKLLAFGTLDGRVGLMDTATRQTLKWLSHSPNGGSPHLNCPIFSVAFSPDGKRLASGGGIPLDVQSAIVWDVSSGKQIVTLSTGAKARSTQEYLHSAVFSPDGNYLVTGGEDKIVRVWNIATQKCQELTTHTNTITGVVFSPDGLWMATSSDNSIIKVWDARAISTSGRPREMTTLRGHTKSVKAITFTPDSRTLISGGLDETIRLWDVAQFTPPMLPTQSGTVNTLVYSHNGKWLATCGDKDKNIARIWNARTHKLQAATPIHAKEVYVAFAPDGNTLAVASADKSLTLCDTQTGREIACFQAATEDIDADIFRSVAFSPNGKFIVTGGGNTKKEPEFHPSPYNGYHARLWDVATHKEIPEFTHHLGHTGWIMAMAFSPDGKMLVTGGGSGELRWWNPETRQEIGRPPRQVQGSTVPSQFVHQDTILSVTFSPDGRLLATGSRDHTARIWDVKSREPLFHLSGHNASVEALAFSPDGKTLATGSRDGVIKLWALSTLRDHQVLDTLTLISDQEGLHSLAFSPDGNTLASGHGSGNVLFWQAERK